MSIPFTLDIATQPTTKDIKWLSAGDWATFDDLVSGLEAGDELEQAAFTVKVDTADSDTASTSVQRIINQVESVNGQVTDTTRRVLFYFQPADTEKMKTAHNYDLQIWVRRGSSVYNRTILRGRIYAREDITNTTTLLDPATTLTITNGATANGVPGDQLQLVTEVRDGGGALHPEYNPVYSTSDGAIATVDANGLVSFWTAGSVVISATLAAFGLADSIAITVAGTPSTAVEGDILTYRTSAWVPENPHTRFDTRYVKRGGDTVAGAYTWSDVATFSAVPVFTSGVPTLLPSTATKDIGATGTRWRDGWFSGAVAVATLESSVGVRSKRNGSDTALAGPYFALENASGTRRYSWQLGDTANDWLKLFFWNGTTDTNIFSITASGGVNGAEVTATRGLMATGGHLTDQASAAHYAAQGGGGRIVVQGVDTSTLGVFDIIGTKSNGTTITTYLAFAAGGAATFNSSVTVGQTYGAVISGVYTSPLATFGANYYSTGAARVRPDTGKAGMMIEMDVTDSWQFSYITSGGVATYPFKVTTAGAVTGGAASFTTGAFGSPSAYGVVAVKSSAETSVGGFSLERASNNGSLRIWEDGTAWRINSAYSGGGNLLPIIIGAAIGGTDSITCAVDGHVIIGANLTVGASTFVVTAATGAVYAAGDVGIGRDGSFLGGQTGYRCLSVQGSQAGGGGLELINSSGNATAEFGKIEFLNLASGVLQARAVINAEGDGDLRNAQIGFWIQNPGDSDALGVMKIDHLGNMGLGTLDGIKPVTASEKLRVLGAAVVSGDTRRVMMLQDATAFAAGVGAGIAFTGKYNTAGDHTVFGGLKFIKENATDGNTAGAFVVATAANGATPTERLRISSAGVITAGGDYLTSRTANGDVVWSATNLSTGTAARAKFALAGDASTFAFFQFGTGYSTSGVNIADSSMLYSNSPVGMNFVTDNATAIQRFYTGSGVLALAILANQTLKASSLAGTGSRAVMADANGVLSAP